MVGWSKFTIHEPGRYFWLIVNNFCTGWPLVKSGRALKFFKNVKTCYTACILKIDYNIVQLTVDIQIFNIHLMSSTAAEKLQ